MVNYFKENLIRLRQSRKLTQHEAATAMGFKRNTYANYEGGHTEPSIDAQLIISRFYGISLDILVTTTPDDASLIPKIESKRIRKDASLNASLNASLTTKNDSIALPEPTHPDDLANVYDLDSKAAAGVAELMSDQDRLKQLPNLYYPNLGFGVHVRIQIKGDSMGRTVRDGDHVLATWLQGGVQELRQGAVHVVIDKEEGLVCKRVYLAGKTEVELVSDNESYSPYKRHLRDILLLFKVQEVHSRDLSNYHEFGRTEIGKIWKEIDSLKKRLKG